MNETLNHGALASAVNELLYQSNGTAAGGQKVFEKIVRPLQKQYLAAVEEANDQKQKQAALVVENKQLRRQLNNQAASNEQRLSKVAEKLEALNFRFQSDGRSYSILKEVIDHIRYGFSL